MHAHVGAVATTSGARLATAQPNPLIATQLRRPTPRRPLQVTNCLKCAAQQLQQLIELPQNHHNNSSAARGQQIEHQQQQQQQQQDCQHAAAWPPTLVLAAAGWQTGPTNSSGSRSSRLAAAAGGSERTSDSLPSPAAQQEVQHIQQQEQQAFPDILEPHPQQQQQQQASPDILEPHPQQQQQQAASDAGAAEGGGIDSRGVRAALAALKWYKGFLSPSMASTCRFLPTCSQYSMDSYRKYGVAKGTVLTAWRLLRCNPWGGSGIDNTAWPPVGLPPWLFSAPYSAEVVVVLGAALFVRFSHALLFE